MEDRISQLSDDILISIISLIPTKQALSTSFLSKRWRNLFRFVSDVAIDLSCNKKNRLLPLGCSDPPAFIHGVHGFLQRHSTCIHSFDFQSCLPRSSAQTFEQCILSLGGLGIQKLIICLPNYCYCGGFFGFSCHLLSLMPALHYFKLSRVELLPSMENPCYSLKTIWLHFVIASQGSLDCIFSNCLSLSTLTLEWCSLPSTLCFQGPNLQLKSVSVLYCGGLEEILFYAPNLTNFDLECVDPDNLIFDYTPVNLIFDYAPQLQSVHLISQDSDVPYFCGKLEKNVPNLNTLHLDAIGDLYQDGSIAMGTNMFSNLKRLELAVCDHEFNLFSLIRVLNGCPRLEEFQLATWVKAFEWLEEEKQMKLHSQLKVVDISGFGGSENEFAFVSYILKNTVKLQQMIISWYIYMNNRVPGGNRETSYLPPLKGYYKKEKAYFRPPLPGEWEWEQVCGCIHRMKHEEAISETLQVVTQEFPKKN